MSVNYEKRYQELKATFRLDYQAPPSLLHFLEKDVWKHTSLDPKSNLKILELGCGAGSTFTNNAKEPKITAVDLAPTALEYARENTEQNNIIYMQGEWGGDFPYFPENEFDFILDAHCLHCIVEKEQRTKALEQAYQVLKPGGWMGVEHMVSHSGMEFDAPYQFFHNTLFYAGEPQRYIPHSIEIEDEIKAAGFEIRYLRVFETLKIIPVTGRSTPLKSDPDLLRLLCIKMEG